MTFIITAEGNKFERVIMAENQALIIHCHRAARSTKVRDRSDETVSPTLTNYCEKDAFCGSIACLGSML